MTDGWRSCKREIGAEQFVRGKIRCNLTDWARFALPEGQTPAAHHLLLLDALSDVYKGNCDRLMVLMPPGSAKSTYASVLFPAFWFMHRPESNIIASAHTASLAAMFGGRIRNLIADKEIKLGYTLGGERARHSFVLDRGGSYYAAGVHGAITGRRADLILIDDPVRAHEDADSVTRRDHVWNWYCSDLLTRLKPSGCIILIMTRWHEDDLGGRLLEHEPGWHRLKLPALSVGNDPLGRAPGEALWPEWEDAQALARKRAMLGERNWAALFQQEPRPVGSTLFKVPAIVVVNDSTPVRTVRAWDLAATGQTGSSDPDWTVGLKLGREASGRFVVLDIVRLRGSPHDVEAAITRTAESDGIETLVTLPQDPGQAGKSQVLYLANRLAGYRVQSSPETGAKTTRAMPVASQIEAGNMALVRGPWNGEFITELRDFPLGRKDDQVDAFSRAFAALSEMGKSARRLGRVDKVSVRDSPGSV